MFSKPITYLSCLIIPVLFFTLSAFFPTAPETENSDAAPTVAPIEDFGSVPCLNKKLSIIVYIVKDSLGDPPPPPDPANIEQQIRDAVDSSNKDFSPICLSFNICEFKYIDNFKFDDMDSVPNADSTDDLLAILDLYYKPNVINLYIVNDYANSPGDECGFTFMPPGIQKPDTFDFIVLEKPCLQGKGLSHLLGHFFGLYHTFESTVAELIDGSNCAIAGDSICDTPADPSNQGNVDGNCNYSGPPLFDADTVFYFPPVDNIMSYYKTCRCRFTREQYIRLVQQYLATRTYLW